MGDNSCSLTRDRHGQTGTSLRVRHSCASREVSDAKHGPQARRQRAAIRSPILCPEAQDQRSRCALDPPARRPEPREGKRARAGGEEVSRHGGGEGGPHHVAERSLGACRQSRSGRVPAEVGGVAVRGRLPRRVPSPPSGSIRPAGRIGEGGCGCAQDLRRCSSKAPHRPSVPQHNRRLGALVFRTDRPG